MGLYLTFALGTDRLGAILGCARLAAVGAHLRLFPVIPAWCGAFRWISDAPSCGALSFVEDRPVEGAGESGACGFGFGAGQTGSADKQTVSAFPMRLVPLARPELFC